MRDLSKPSPAFKPSPVEKRSVVIGGHKTSVSLEDQFWTAIKEIASGRGMKVKDLVSLIDANRTAGNLSSALRLFVLAELQDALFILEHFGDKPDGERRAA